ncbi:MULTISPECIES: alpha/beta fold hydrolase [Pandoraea]|uniref:Alpha/beta hydrolase n=1 Tax=Pandoraea communis TaxID=2508297 RepID=A0A5E4RPT6_9BURK|nr:MULTISPECIES: alpha/beta fold hydrolase [Pandoraea]EON14670.1 alpha/beta hydrolase [Pandoraea sp. SD6-2]MDM8358361.1 alpha/beta fold hydrolase [Pandoraea communis]VVD64781.1 alpha/beta hydrolase [Pandoraea communis]
MPSLAVEIPAVDAYPLGAHAWYPDALPARGVVLIHPATAVPERLYFAFAQYVAQRGLIAVTYSYRGIDGSRPPALRGFPARMRDWADLDVEGVTRWAFERYPSLPVYAVGHSFGGHAIGLCESSNRLVAAVQVASHAGSMRVVSHRRERARITVLMHWVAPVLARLAGYLPGRKLGFGEDLPAGVLLEWRGWTRLPNYFFDDPTLDAEARFAHVRTPILSLGFDDDLWATPMGIDMLVSRLRNAPVTRREIPAIRSDAGSIGHMGYFRQRSGAFLWPETVDWLLSAGSTSVAAGSNDHGVAGPARQGVSMPVTTIPSPIAPT